ncbi:MAG: hypothetical protein NXI30_12630 [bacterium]|nr:hypothetical protein [bacterium]
MEEGRSPTFELSLLPESGEHHALCREYWRTDESGAFVHKVADLASQFGVPSARVLKTVTAASIARSTEFGCADCGIGRVVNSRANLTEIRRDGRHREWVCADCANDRRSAAAERAEREADRRYEILDAAAYRREPRHLDRDGVTFREAVFLVSALRSLASEDFSFLFPYDGHGGTLAPTGRLARVILDELFEGRILSVHPGSSADSVTIEDEAFKSFIPFRVHWLLLRDEDGPSVAKVLEQLESAIADPDWQDLHSFEVAELQRLVALHECLQYLEVVLDDHGFTFSPGDRTVHVIQTALRSFSVGQVYSFIWRAAKDAAAFYLREAKSRKHAANVVPGAIQRMVERALAQGWEVNAFRRDFRAPESVLGQVLFSHALKIPDMGFTTIPPGEPEADQAGEHETGPDF